MTWIWDVVAIAILVLAVFISWKRGFFKSIMRLVSWVLAAALAIWAATPLASGIFDRFMRDTMVDSVAQQLQGVVDSSSATLQENWAAVLESLPSSIQNYLVANGFGSADALSAELGNTVGNTPQEMAELVVDQVVSPAAKALLALLCGIVLFVVLAILLHVVVNLLDRVLKLPVLRSLNRSLGAIIGLLQGVLLVAVYVLAVRAACQSSGGDGLLSAAAYESTRLVRPLAEALSGLDWFSLAR